MSAAVTWWHVTWSARGRGRMLSTDQARPETLGCQREKFYIPAGVTYLNCAAMCPLPRASYDAGVRRLAARARPWSIKHPEAEHEDAAGARHRFARLIGARPEDIAIVAASSYGVAIAATNLSIGSGQTIVMPGAQHQSNALHWDVLAREAGAAVLRVPRPARG
ncbi:MAG: aminotransferase class V-fold PLP-dependent enzyme, partial [Alphaproteobacteria bacterium]|nr:aminotransferase class V-fold PLP-dependent enzyme [Alphaproteobacteria bacterium]